MLGRTDWDKALSLPVQVLVTKVTYKENDIQTTDAIGMFQYTNHYKHELILHYPTTC